MTIRDDDRKFFMQNPQRKFRVRPAYASDRGVIGCNQLREDDPRPRVVIIQEVLPLHYYKLALTALDGEIPDNDFEARRLFDNVVEAARHTDTANC